MNQTFRRMLKYDRWANLEALASIESLAQPSDRASGLIGHIAVGHWVWLSRVREVPLALSHHVELTLIETRHRLDQVYTEWEAWLDRIGPDELAALVRYTTTEGKQFSNTRHDMLTQVLLHGAYHRGQIASEVRARGGVPAATDFIFAARGGVLD